MNWVEKMVEKNCEGKMNYPEAFKKRCLRFYPGDRRIKSLVEKNSFLLGEELKKKMPSKISNSLILNTKTAEEIERLKKQAKVAKQKIRLYNDWYRLYEEQYLSTGNYINSYGLHCYSPEVQLEYDIKVGKIKVSKRVTSAQLASLERNLDSRLSQNAERRRVGSERAGQYWCR